MTSKVIVVRLIGGLGNQLFQLQYATKMQKKMGGKLVVDTSFLNASSKPHESLAVGDLIRDYQLQQLGCFDLKIKRTLERFLTKAGLPVACWLKPAYHFECSCHDPSGMGTLIIDGFWQSKSHLDKDFVADLSLNLQSHESGIVPNDSVCVHVRRGDYLTNRHWLVKQQEVIPLDYYEHAFARFRGDLTRPRFDVYTDDEPWAIQAFKHVKDASIIPSSTLMPIELMAKMASYQNFVIANSTLSWWAAVAAKEEAKRVILPKSWGKGIASDQYHCDGWIAI